MSTIPHVVSLLHDEAIMASTTGEMLGRGNEGFGADVHIFSKPVDERNNYATRVDGNT